MQTLSEDHFWGIQYQFLKDLFFSAILTYPTRTTIKNAKKLAIMRFYIISSYEENSPEADFQCEFDTKVSNSVISGDLQLSTI